MADNEDHHPPTSSLKSAVADKLEVPWKYQRLLPLWCPKDGKSPLNKPVHDARRIGDYVGQKSIEDRDSKCVSSENAAEDDSGLELSLGLSLGGPSCKLNPKIGPKGVPESDQRSGMIVKEETSPTSPSAEDSKGPTRRLNDVGMSRSQAFWQELVLRDSLKQEKMGSPSSDAQLRERHAQSQSAHSTPISSLSSLCSSTVRGLSMHVGITDAWCSTENSAGEDSKPGLANRFWQAVKEKDRAADRANVKEEMRPLKDLFPAVNQTTGASTWGQRQRRVSVQLLDEVKGNREGSPRITLSSPEKNGQIQPATPHSVLPDGGTNSITATPDGINVGQRLGEGEPFQQLNIAKGETSGEGEPFQQLNIAKGETSSPDDCVKATSYQHQHQRHAHDAIEQQKKQRRQEARKKRKALLEEQKLQKKPKKNDDCGVSSGASLKQSNQTMRPGTPASGSKISSTGPLPATSREFSRGKREVSSSPDSQDGGSTNSGFQQPSSCLWQHGGASESLATSSPEKPADNGSPSIEIDNVEQLHEIRLALQRERDRAAKEHERDLERKEPEPRQSDCEQRSSVRGGSHQAYGGEELTKLYSAVCRASHESAGIRCSEKLTNLAASLPKAVPSTYSCRALARASSLGSMQVKRGALARRQSVPNLPSTPELGPVRTQTGDVLPSDGNPGSNSAFASLVAAVEASQGLSAAVASVCVGASRPSLISGGSWPSYERGLVGAHEDMNGTTSSTKTSRQESEACFPERAPNSQNEEGNSLDVDNFQQGITQAIPTAEGLVNHVGQVACNLKLGIAAGQIFGGSGSSPDLPWVTCTGAGGSGKSICGVVYKYKKGQVRIVCACHGSHMSPSDFVKHAGSLDPSNPEKNIVLGPFALGSSAPPSVQG